MEVQVHGFAFSLDDGFVDDLNSCQVVGWIGDGGFFQPISINVWRMGTIILAVMYSANSYASEAEDTTNLLIWEIVRIAPFHLGVGSFSDKTMWAPARLRALGSLLNPSSEWAARIMSLAR